jgi:hypothetical protein
MAHNALVDRQNTQHYKEVLKYQTKQYELDTQYAWDMFKFQQSEWDRQSQFLERAGDQIERNLLSNYSQMIQRQIEEQMASAFGLQTAERQSRAERAQAQVMADARGVEGNSVDSLIADIARHEGESATVIALNRSATSRQLMMEAMGLKASADADFNKLPIKSWSTLAPVNTPAPVSPVAPQPPVAQPNVGAAVANIVGGVTQGFVNYANWSGQSVSQAFKIK